MIENIGAYSQVDYDRGYQQGYADGSLTVTTEILDKFRELADERIKRYKAIYPMATEYWNLDLNEIDDIINDMKKGYV